MRKRRNKLVCTILCMAMVAVCFTGCGKDKAVDETMPIVEVETEENYVNSSEFIVEPETEATEEILETEEEETEEVEVAEESQNSNATDTSTTDTSTDNVVSVPATDGADYSYVTLIGDSVMLGAAENIAQSMPGCVVDAKESRQVRKGVEIAQELEQQGNLRSTVVIALGTNGTFSTETGQALIDYLGTDRNIYWIYACGVSWQDDSNGTIATLAANNANVTVIDWPAYAADHSDYFYSDGIHLNGTGRAAYAQMIVNYVN